MPPVRHLTVTARAALLVLTLLALVLLALTRPARALPVLAPVTLVLAALLVGLRGGRASVARVTSTSIALPSRTTVSVTSSPDDVRPDERRQRLRAAHRVVVDADDHVVDLQAGLRRRGTVVDRSTTAPARVTPSAVAVPSYSVDAEERVLARCPSSMSWLATFFTRSTGIAKPRPIEPDCCEASRSTS